MKKFVAIILAILCVVSIPMGAFASELHNQDNQQFCLNFNVKTEEDLKIIYSSEGRMEFDTPVEFTFTENTPVCINYDFVCWQDNKTGILYFPGDKIIVSDTISLDAVWNEKDKSTPDFLNVLIARIRVLIRKISTRFGLYDISKYAVPVTINNCKLIVNGKDITDDVYVMIDYDTETVELPFLAIIEELGAEVEWKNNDVVIVTYNGMSQEIDTKDSDFGIAFPPGGGNSKYVRKIVNEDLIIDHISVISALKFTFNASVTIDYDEAVIIIDQGTVL